MDLLVIFYFGFYGFCSFVCLPQGYLAPAAYIHLASGLPHSMYT
ncbi:hypothetical protein [Caudoviricetes sp.]|nr:hypothetical protein [Caudoviricetes sp.]